MCDCSNIFCKILCTIVLVVAFLFNTIGNWVGVGDIIPTESCVFDWCTEEDTTVPPSESTTEQESSKAPSTTDVTQPSTEVTTSPSEESTTAPASTTSTTAPTTVTTTTTTTTTKPTTTTTTARPTTTAPPETDAGPHIQSATQLSLGILGGSDDDNVKGVAPLSDGGYVICGISNSTDGTFASAYTSGWKKPYSFVARYTKAGRLKWVKGFGSTSAPFYLEDVAVLSDDSIVAVGYTQAPEYAFNNETKDSFDAVILKLSYATGTLNVRKIFGGSKSDIFYCVEPTANGFIVGGKSYSSDEYFSYLSGESAILMDFSSNLTLNWEKHLHGNAASRISDVAVDGSGNIFAACLTSSKTDDFAEYAQLIGGYTDTVVLKYNSEGAKQWGKVISSSGRDEFSQVAPDGKGGCVVAGYYELVPSNFPDGTLKDIHHCGNIDALVFRFNANGSQRWVKTLSGYENDFITDIIQTKGGFAVAGYTASSNREFAEPGNEGLLDGFVSFINTNGITVKNLTQAGTRNEMATCLALTTENYVYVLGRTESADVDFDGLHTYSSAAYIGKYSFTVE